MCGRIINGGSLRRRSFTIPGNFCGFEITVPAFEYGAFYVWRLSGRISFFYAGIDYSVQLCDLYCDEPV